MIGSLAFVAGLAFVSLRRSSDRSKSVVSFEIEVRDENDHPSACRVHLRTADGQVWKSSTWPAYDDHFVYPGKAALPLEVGRYSYEVERGPEYRSLRGSFEVAKNQPTGLRLRLERLTELAKLGWYSGDLHIHRKVEDVPLLMRAEDLHVGPVVTWWNSDDPNQPSQRGLPVRFDVDRATSSDAGEDERWGGALLYFGLEKPLRLPPSMRDDEGRITHREGDEKDEYPAPAELARMARGQAGVHIDIEKPFWWDVASWVGLGFADTIAIAYNQMTRTSLHNGEAWGRERDLNRYDGPFGDAFWTQDIYYHIIDAGIRLAPSAGSASGALPNPVGYDRVYVHLDGAFDHDAWWRALKAGSSFVTNGPLLLVEANGQLPGHVFHVDEGARVDIALTTRLMCDEPVGRIQLIRDGGIVQTGTQTDGGVAFESLAFERSGWFLVRAIADRSDNFRFASTAPFYVEIGSSPRRISRSAVQFFIDWIDERMSRLGAGSMPPEKLESVMAFQREGRQFWQSQLGQANAE